MIYKFSQLFSWSSGKPIIPNGGDIPVYGSNGIIGYTDKAKFNNKLILGRVGANCGSVEYCKTDFNATDNTLITKCNESLIKYYYAYYLLKQYNLNTFAGGAAQPLITQSILKHLKCDIPDLNIQEKVSLVLRKYDDSISINNQRIELLEQMSEDLYKEWFIRFRFPGYKNYKFVIQNPRGWMLSTCESKMRIPIGWKYDELTNIAEFKRGKNVTAAEMVEGEIPVISAGLNPSGYHNEANVFGKNITVSSSGANAGYLSYHLGDIWAADCSYYQNDSNLWFVYNALKFLQPVISNMQVGSAQPHVYAKTINKLSTIIPPNELIELYCEKVNPIYEQIRLLTLANKNLVKQRDALLPRLMSGKLNLEGKEIV